jgi:precorrin-2 methylase
MSHELTDFLVSLADPAFLKTYSEDPDAAMRQAGLSDVQQQAVRDRDLSSIHRLTAAEMSDSLYGRLLARVHEEPALKFELTLDFGVLPDADTRDDGSVDAGQGRVTRLDDDEAHPAPGNASRPRVDRGFATAGPAAKNELVIVGSGITGANHLTAEAAAHIASADRVLYCVADLVIERRLRCLNPNAEDLCAFYADHKPRQQSYEEMVARILEVLRRHRRVCAVFYGHPGIFVWPSFRAVEQARHQGYLARMLPAVSSLDCLFADIGVDPSCDGCQIVEATDLLVRSKRPDVSASVIIFQAGLVGDLGYDSRGYDGSHVAVLAEYLASFYGASHEIVLYEAAQCPVSRPRTQRVPLSDLQAARLSGATTLFIPPKERLPASEDMLVRLGLKRPRA